MAKVGESASAEVILPWHGAFWSAFSSTIALPESIYLQPVEQDLQSIEFVVAKYGEIENRGRKQYAKQIQR